MPLVKASENLYICRPDLIQHRMVLACIMSQFVQEWPFLGDATHVPTSYIDEENTELGEFLYEDMLNL